jgi:hypothetical protein
VCVTTTTRARGPDDGGGVVGGVGDVGVDESSPEHADVIIVSVRMIAARKAIAAVVRTRG